jgi:hypothetical protein
VEPKEKVINLLLSPTWSLDLTFCCLDGLWRGFKSMDGIHLAQHWVQWPAAVNIVVIFRLSWRASYFLTEWLLAVVYRYTETTEWSRIDPSLPHFSGAITLFPIILPYILLRSSRNSIDTNISRDNLLNGQALWSGWYLPQGAEVKYKSRQRVAKPLAPSSPSVAFLSVDLL